MINYVCVLCVDVGRMPKKKVETAAAVTYGLLCDQSTFFRARALALWTEVLCDFVVVVVCSLVFDICLQIAAMRLDSTISNTDSVLCVDDEPRTLYAISHLMILCFTNNNNN